MYGCRELVIEIWDFIDPCRERGRKGECVWGGGAWEGLGGWVVAIGEGVGAMTCVRTPSLTRVVVYRHS